MEYKQGQREKKLFIMTSPQFNSFNQLFKSKLDEIWCSGLGLGRWQWSDESTSKADKIKKVGPCVERVARLHWCIPHWCILIPNILATDPLWVGYSIATYIHGHGPSVIVLFLLLYLCNPSKFYKNKIYILFL